MKLHLGCGKRDFGKGWVNIDAGNFPHVTSHDIVKLPFENAVCDLIYSSHTLEYFDRDEVVPVLKEWCRVLKPHGILRLAVPDLTAMVDLYLRQEWPIESFLGPLYGKMIPEGCTDSIYHKTAYDFRSLRELLLCVGFCDIQTYDWQKTEHAGVDDHSQAYLPHMDKANGTLISLNVEATKVI